MVVTEQMNIAASAVEKDADVMVEGNNQELSKRRKGDSRTAHSQSNSSVGSFDGRRREQ